MQAKIYLFFLMSFALNVVPCAAITIVEDGPAYDAIGFNNEFPHVNGEYNCMNYLCNDHDIVFDIGANAGDWSAEVFKHKNVTMYAFEPMPSLVNHMRQRFAGKAIYIHQLAISDTAGDHAFDFYPTVTHLSTLYDRPIVANLPHERCVVQMTTLDDFCAQNNLPHVNFVKIDTEGNEFNVMVGARKLLKNKAIDALQFEYGGTYRDAYITLRQIFSLLKDNGYEVYRIAPQFLIHIARWRDELENFQYSNYLALAIKNSALVADNGDEI